MKAIICTKYGPPDVLQLKEVPAPVPRDHEVRIRIRATTITTGDCRVRGFDSPLAYWIPMRLFLGVTKPRKPILGVELAGDIEAVGRQVKRFKPGDPVFASTGMRFGAHAEYICLPEDGLLAPKPDNATYEEAAGLIFGGTTALHFLRKAKIRPGHRVLIYGASGAVGTSAVQIAKHLGADVTGVCSTANLEWIGGLGADHVIDYTVEDYANNQGRYDIIFDAVGKTSKSKSRPALAPGGTFVSVEGQGTARELQEDLYLLKELVEAGKLKTVIDRVYPLERAAEAHAYVETGRKKGNVVIKVG